MLTYHEPDRLGVEGSPGPIGERLLELLSADVPAPVSIHPENMAFGQLSGL